MDIISTDSHSIIEGNANEGQIRLISNTIECKKTLYEAGVDLSDVFTLPDDDSQNAIISLRNAEVISSANTFQYCFYQSKNYKLSCFNAFFRTFLVNKL